MDAVVDLGWGQALRTLLDRGHLVAPSRLAEMVAEAVAPLGLRSTIWLVDYEQRSLHALSVPGRETPGRSAWTARYRAGRSRPWRPCTLPATAPRPAGGGYPWWTAPIDSG
ncbi:hypothetical protein [Plantactinospora veratri]